MILTLFPFRILTKFSLSGIIIGLTEYEYVFKEKPKSNGNAF